MNLVVDANILFSALIKTSTTRRIFCEKNLVFYGPDFLLNELKKHENEILEKTGKSKEEFKIVLSALFEIINIISEDELTAFEKTARRVCPDENDWPYFALSLKLNVPIWSNDSILKNQNTIKIINTKELLELIY